MEGWTPPEPLSLFKLTDYVPRRQRKGFTCDTQSPRLTSKSPWLLALEAELAAESSKEKQVIRTGQFGKSR